MRTCVYILLGAVCLTWASGPARGDTKQLSPEQFDALDKRGYFTPAFKAAIRDLVDVRAELAQTTSEKDKLTKQLPTLQTQAAQAEAEVVAMRQEMAMYDHPEDNDFDALEARMKDPSVKPPEQLALAQAYVWTYPTSPHQAEAQRYVQQIEKQLADQQRTEAASEASRAAAHARLIERAKAHDLSLPEWRELLRNMSQQDLVKLMGHPTSESDEYWIYAGDWVTNPATHQKAGLELNFNGTRVLNVDEKSP